MRAPGKKVGKLAVKLERKTSRYRRAEVSVELRLEVSDGTFHAQYEGTWYSAKTRDALAELIRKAAEKTIDLEWTRYLVVDYKATAWPEDGNSGRPCQGGSYETLSITDDRAELAKLPGADRWSDRRENRLITSISLSWSVCEFSQPYTLPEDKSKTVRMRREVDHQLIRGDDDEEEKYREVTGTPEEQDDDRLPAGAVPWTSEREQLLRDVLTALGKLDARMVELFRGDPDQLARRLDAAALNPARLLATGQEIDDE